MTNRDEKMMRVPNSFRKYLYELKSENPSKSLKDIMDELAQRGKKKEKKKGMWPKF